MRGSFVRELMQMIGHSCEPSPSSNQSGPEGLGMRRIATEKIEDMEPPLVACAGGAQKNLEELAEESD